MSEWVRQKKEINAYNVFLSSITSKYNSPGFASHEYRLVDPFVEVDDPYNNVSVEPDFALCSPDTLLLVEVKSGENVEEDHADQMKRYNQVGLEAAEAFLSNADVDYSVSRVESCIVYDEEFLYKCREEWENCAKTLEPVESKVPVLSQKKGSTLQISGPEVFEDDQLTEILSNGIPLPKAPQRNIFLSENAEKESLAVSICHDIVLNNLVGRFSVSPVEVRNFYGKRPNLTVDRVERTLIYLNHIGACDLDEETGLFMFTEHHEDEIIGVETRVRNERVEESLSEIDEDQVSLGDIDYSQYQAEEDEE